MSKIFYKIYHANLAFSSIPTSELSNVIDTAYFPLLKLIQETKTKTALEMTGYTLEKISELKPKFIDTFKQLHNEGLIELIGSGYSQIIGPVIPYKVNQKNQQLGIDVYKQILGITPKVAFLNEQSFSSSMVDIYYESGYKAIVMEWNNAYSLNQHWDKSFLYSPVIIKGIKHNLPILWSDSILFQKFQRVAQGQINDTRYFEFLRKYIVDKFSVVPIYSSDLEIFNYRPGRFHTESKIIKDEWKKIKNILKKLKKYGDFELPTHIIDKYTRSSIQIDPINNKNFIIVKKQLKYSLSRWMVCGRGANTINTLCFNHYQTMENSKYNWKKLLEYWGSDYRTHITQEKWNTGLEYLRKNTPVKENAKQEVRKECKINFKIRDDFLVFEKEGLKVIFNIKKGMALTNVLSNSKILPFGTINHGQLDLIQHGADYYTGTTVIESVETKRITDLNSYSFNCYALSEHEYEVYFEQEIHKGFFEEKKWRIDTKENSIMLHVKVTTPHFINGSIRLGTFTLLENSVNKDVYIKLKNGGALYEKFFLFENELNQHTASSLIQSSKSGFSATNGKIKFYQKNKKLFSLEINQSVSYPYVMLQNNKDRDNYLTRFYFSLQEVDDTLKENSDRCFELEYKIKL